MRGEGDKPALAADEARSLEVKDSGDGQEEPSRVTEGEEEGPRGEEKLDRLQVDPEAQAVEEGEEGKDRRGGGRLKF